MIDVTVPKNVLSEVAKAELMAALARTLMYWEGAAESNAVAESLAWTFLHEPELVTVAGTPAGEPRYRVVVGVAQAALSDEAKRGLVEDMTEQVLAADRAERGLDISFADDSWRVWVIINEIQEGNWGGAGEIFRLADLSAFTGVPPLEVATRLARLDDLEAG